jgi:hypothetical protein
VISVQLASKYYFNEFLVTTNFLKAQSARFKYKRGGEHIRQKGEQIFSKKIKIFIPT